MNLQSSRKATCRAGPAPFGKFCRSMSAATKTPWPRCRSDSLTNPSSNRCESGRRRKTPPRRLRRSWIPVKQRELAIKRVRQVYDEHPMSLHLFGERFNQNAYIGLASLAQEDGQYVKCTFGTPKERTEAEFALQTASHIVVDITAIATIRLLRSRRAPAEYPEVPLSE